MPPHTKTGIRAEPSGFEDVLWKAADKLRGSMDASEYKHVVLGLIFLKYVEDAFEERRMRPRSACPVAGPRTHCGDRPRPAHLSLPMAGRVRSAADG